MYFCFYNTTKLVLLICEKKAVQILQYLGESPWYNTICEKKPLEIGRALNCPTLASQMNCELIDHDLHQCFVHIINNNYGGAKLGAR